MEAEGEERVAEKSKLNSVLKDDEEFLKYGESQEREKRGRQQRKVFWAETGRLGRGKVREPQDCQKAGEQ